MVKSNIQLKHSNYVAFSHFHGIAVNNIGLIFISQINIEIIPVLFQDMSNFVEVHQIVLFQSFHFPASAPTYKF